MDVWCFLWTHRVHAAFRCFTQCGRLLMWSSSHVTQVWLNQGGVNLLFWWELFFTSAFALVKSVCKNMRNSRSDQTRQEAHCVYWLLTRRSNSSTPGLPHTEIKSEWLSVCKLSFISFRRSLRHFRGSGCFERPGHLLPGERRPEGRVRRPVGPQRCTDGEREGVGDAVHG